MEELYRCYDSETTGACFAVEKIDKPYRDYEYFTLTREECEEEKVYSRIEGFKFDWEKKLNT